MNVEAAVENDTVLVPPLAVNVVVPLILLLLAAVMLSTVMLPPVCNVRPVAVIFSSSAALISNPTAVSPSPIPVPSESISVVAAPPLVITPVVFKLMSLAVIDNVAPPVLNVSPAPNVKSPVPSVFVSASMVVVPPVVRLSLMVTPDTAFNVRAPAPVMLSLVASSVKDPAEVNVTPAAS